MSNDTTNPDKTQNQVRDKRQAGWFAIDNEIVDLHGPTIGAYGLAVYMTLCRFANTADQCFPSINTLASRLDASRPTIRKAIACLVECGLVSVEPRTDSKGDPDTNLYTILPVAKKGVVNDVDQGGKPHLPGVVNDVDPNKTQSNNTQLTTISEPSNSAIEESDPIALFDAEIRAVEPLQQNKVKGNGHHKPSKPVHSEPVYPEWKALCLAYSKATGIYSAQVAPVIKTLLVDYPDATGAQLTQFYANWPIAHPSLDMPVKPDSLSRNFGPWRNKQGVIKDNDIPRELLLTSRPGMVRHPDYPDGNLLLTKAQYRALMNDRAQIASMRGDHE